MAELMRSRTVTVSIARTPDEVYDFVATPENLPRWAPTFALAVQRDGERWLVETPEGPMGLDFEVRNRFRVADHRVTVQPGLEVLNQLRVLVNGDGAELLFTLFQLVGMSDEQFATDAANVESDLHLLKHLLEMGEA